MAQGSILTMPERLAALVWRTSWALGVALLMTLQVAGAGTISVFSGQMDTDQIAMRVQPTGTTNTVSPADFVFDVSPAEFVGPGCRASIPGFNINAHGRVQTVFCRVENPGSYDTVIRIDFSYVSVGGVSGFVASPVISLTAGQLATLTAAITVPVAFDVFIVQATMMRVITTPGGVLAIPYQSLVFKFNVRVCTSGTCL